MFCTLLCVAALMHMIIAKTQPMELCREQGQPLTVGIFVLQNLGSHFKKQQPKYCNGAAFWRRFALLRQVHNQWFGEGYLE